MKYLVLPVQTTEYMDGFSALAVELSEDTKKTILKLQENFEKVQKIDESISSLTYYSEPFSVEIFSENFEKDLDEEGTVLEITDEELDHFSDCSENDYRVGGATMRVSSYGITIVYFSKWSIDEAWAEVSFGTILEKLTKL